MAEKIQGRAGRLDLTIEQGATFRLLLTWRDEGGALRDLTGYTARMQIRREAADDTVLLALTTENGGISLGGAAGTIALLATSDQTAALGFESGVYDLELEDGSGEVTRLLSGTATLSAEVTR